MLNTYCDLNTFLRKPLVVKGLNNIDKDGKEVEGDKFTIPGQITVKFTMKLSEYVQKQDSIAKGETQTTDDEVINDTKNMVLEILNLDKQHKYTLKNVDENFDDLIVMQALIKAVINYVYEIDTDPNSNSPESK